MNEEPVDRLNLDRLLALDRREHLSWLMEELDVQFSSLVSKHVRSLDENYSRLASKLHAYFTTAAIDEHPKVQQIAKEALDQIEKKFPWFKDRKVPGQAGN